MRPIDADALSEHKFVSINCYLKSNVDSGYSQYKQGWNDAIDAIIDNAPTVERPTGEWIDHSEDEDYLECPICGRLTNCNGNKEELHYCWNCGAEMRGKEAENENTTRTHQS